MFGAAQWEDESNRHPRVHDNAGNRIFNVRLMELPIEIDITSNVQSINLSWDYTDNCFDGKEFYIVTAQNQVDENGIVSIVNSQYPYSLRTSNFLHVT